MNREVERIFAVEKKVIKIAGRAVQGFKGIGVKPGAFEKVVDDATIDLIDENFI